MRFLVIGAGAVGSYVGGSLAIAAHDVTFLARPPAAILLNASGIRLTDRRTGETRSARTVRAVTSLAAALSAPTYDCLILAVKAYDVEPFVAELASITTAPPSVLSLQNGVAAEGQLTSAFGPGSVVAGTVTSTIVKQPDGTLMIERSRGTGLALGPPLSRPLGAALNQAGLRARLYPAGGPMKWSKLLTNLIGNATSAILDLPVFDLFGDPRLYRIEIETLRECLRVMRGLGLQVVDLPGVPVRLLAWATSLPAPLAQPLLRRGVGAGRGAKMPSLNLDVQAGRPRTEVRWLNGAVVQHGAALGLPTPVNQVLTETVESLTAGRLSLANFRHRPEALLRLMV